MWTLELEYADRHGYLLGGRSGGAFTILFFKHSLVFMELHGLTQAADNKRVGKANSEPILAKYAHVDIVLMLG